MKISIQKLTYFTIFALFIVPAGLPVRNKATIELGSYTLSTCPVSGKEPIDG